MKNISKKQQQTGFSLIELMIAMVLSLIVMAGLYAAYSSSSKSSRVQKAEAELQENARFAFSVMTSIIQGAGDFGCKSASDDTDSLINTTSNTFKPWNVIEGWEAKDTDYGDTYRAALDSSVTTVSAPNWTTSSNAVIDTGIKSKPSSDVFKVWHTQKQRTKVSALAATELTFPAIDLEQGDILVINDCKTIKFAQVCACETSDANACDGTDTKADLSTSCEQPGNNTFDFRDFKAQTTEIDVLEETIFYVAKRGSDATKPPSLFVRNLGNNAQANTEEELLEGVESLQVLYGEDTNNDKSPDYYISANKVVDWKNIVGVRVNLLLRSLQNNLTVGEQTIAFNGGTITTTTKDKHLRRSYSFTISLRNRNVNY